MEPELPEKKKKTRSRTRKDEPGGYLGGLLAIVFIIGIYFGIKYFTNPDADVKGVETNTEKEQQLIKEKEKAKENVKGDIDKRLEKIKEDIDNLSVYDLTTQSPQVKKIISDLQSLQDLPKDQAKNLCQQVCSNF